QDVIIPPSVSNDDATAKYGEYETIFPYLRKAKLPK
ncbi:MAG: peroxidase, partial [Pseudomonadota bacterium]